MKLLVSRGMISVAIQTQVLIMKQLFQLPQCKVSRFLPLFNNSYPILRTKKKG